MSILVHVPAQLWDVQSAGVYNRPIHIGDSHNSATLLMKDLGSPGAHIAKPLQSGRAAEQTSQQVQGRRSLKEFF